MGGQVNTRQNRAHWGSWDTVEVMVWRQKGGDLTKSYDKSPYTDGNVKRAK